MPAFTLIFKSSNTEAKPVRRIVKEVTKAEALAIQAELEVTADVIEAFEEDGPATAG